MQEKSSEEKMTDAHVEEAARLFAILSESSRLKLLRALMPGRQTVSELVETTGIKQGNVSKHLGVLLNARFVKRTREGSFAWYEIADPRLFTLCSLMCERIDADAQNRVAELRRHTPGT